MRCENPKHQAYVNYGGRGIKIWEPWRRDFWGFVFHLDGDKPGPEYTVDRIDVNGHYEPGNVRWATPKEQAENKVLKPKKSREPKPSAPRAKKAVAPKPSKATNRDERAFETLLVLPPDGRGYTKTQLAGFLGISKQAITRWKAVPLRYVRPLSEKTGIPKADLLPSEFA